MVNEATVTGGKRRIDQILAEGFAEGLEGLDGDELRRRRDLARGEREYLSLVRRLLQGRGDILKAEAERRQRGADAGPVMDRLADILAEGSRGPSRGEAPTTDVPADELAMARRRVERLISDARFSNLEGLDDEEIREGRGRLEQEERGVSDTRSRVMAVHDALQEEIKRRYRLELGPAG